MFNTLHAKSYKTLKNQKKMKQREKYIVFHELEYSELDPHKNGQFSRKVSTQSKVKRTVASTNGYEIINSHMLKQTKLNLQSSLTPYFKNSHKRDLTVILT